MQHPNTHVFEETINSYHCVHLILMPFSRELREEKQVTKCLQGVTLMYFWHIFSSIVHVIPIVCEYFQ